MKGYTNPSTGLPREAHGGNPPDYDAPEDACDQFAPLRKMDGSYTKNCRNCGYEEYMHEGESKDEN